MRIVVVMDAVETVHFEKDTSFALMVAAQTRGHEVLHCQVRDLYLAEGRVHAQARAAKMQLQLVQPIALGERVDVALDDVDAVLVRKDPPFDSEYLWATQMLERLQGQTLVMNEARGVREANEKLYACNFPELMPRTLVASDRERIRSFVASVGGRAVIKPLSGARGEGVFVLANDDFNFNAIVETQTLHGRRVAMVQEFLPAIHSEGDKRVLVLGGEPLGAILRVPARGDVRSNLAAGGSAVQTGVTAAERKLIAKLKPKLLADGLYFVGIDLIGGKLTEVNVTSPTGIQHMSRMDGVPYAEQVIAWLEQRLAG